MRFYRINQDWITHLVGNFREEILETLRGLDLVRFQKYPPPKINGLPLGNETRVLSRFLKGRSSQLDASAFSGLYRSRLSREEKILYSAFRQNDVLSCDVWASIIGENNLNRWIENKCLREKNGGLECQFSVVGLDGLVFAVDPMKDHGALWEPDFVSSAARDPDSVPFFHTYIGQDSLQMIEAIESRVPRSGVRYLDCGPGSGGVLLYFARQFKEAIGIDINERAAKLAQFNADLNGLGNCKTYQGDALAFGDRYGKFDLITWNPPFIFMPEENQDDFIDGYGGGELGMGLCLKFIETLPDLLADGGIACVSPLAPILESGENVLETRLNELLPRLRMDCTLQVAQISLAHTRALWHFHRSNGIRKFESVYLYFTHGSGKLKRIEAGATRKIVDALREKLYERKFA